MKIAFMKIVVCILLAWVCASVYQLSLYEEDIYDCSNMVADQERFFNDMGIDTKIGIRYATEDRYAHAWLILPFNIPFESTILSIDPFKQEPDVVFESIMELVIAHPEAEHEFTLSTK
ncbi:MAG: hypothetical protein KAJ93_08005 [Methanosarcinales archaeon]|nr:hypothetical protein [Methanosarcinales archaeon]